MMEELIANLPEPTNFVRKHLYVDPATGIELVVHESRGFELQFFSVIVLSTNRGPLPFTFEIPAKDFDEAVAGWKAAAAEALTRFGEEQRANSRRIIVPGNEAVRPS